MTAGQLDTVINAYVWTAYQADVYGPGLAVAAGVWATVRTIRALRQAAHRVRLHLDLQHIEDHANQTPIREEKP